MTNSNDNLPPLPDIAPGCYRHYKGGLYEVLGVARHSETLAPMVVYRALYGEGGLWVRPAGMWHEAVTVGGQMVARFQKEADPDDQTE